MLPDLRRSFALALCVAATPIWTTDAEASVNLQPCHVDGLHESVLCGTLDVPENRNSAGGRTIALDIVVVPATGGQALDDPVVVLAGGPGQAATDLVGLSLAFLDDARQRRDLLYVDQRGTGESNPLDCDLGGELALFGAGGLPTDAVTDCLAQLEDHADLRLYTTFHAADDLEAVRRALGYGPLNLWGGSYGTRMAMVYEQAYPESVRSMVLDGSAPFELVLPQHNAREAQRALDLLTAACAVDSSCAERYPDTAAKLSSVLDRLADAPEVVTVDHPRTGEAIELTITRESVAGTLRVVLYQTARAALVPRLVEAAFEGDYGPLVAVGLTGAGSVRDSMSLGMTFSVLCSEDHPRIDRAVLERESAGTFLGTTEADAWAAICDAWPQAELPAGFDELATSSAPVLLLSGEADPIVPPTWGETAQARYTWGVHVVVPGAGHGVSHLGCVPEMIAQFIDDGMADEVDVGCADALQRPPFVVGAFGPQP